MPTDTYTIKIKDLLSVEDARERWILVKKALAANVRQESTRAVEFGYVDLDHASDRLRHMMDEQSETMTLPQGLEPVDPSDELSDTRVLLLPWARHFAVQSGLHLASRKGRNKSRPVAPRIVEAAPEVDQDIEEIVESPEIVKLETVAVETTAPVAETVASGEHRIEDLPEVRDEIDEDDTPVSYPFTKATVPAVPAKAARAKTEEELDAEAGNFISAFLDRVMEEEEKVEAVETAIPAKSEDELDAEAGQFISDFIDKVNEEENAAETVAADEIPQASEDVFLPLSEGDEMVSVESTDSVEDEVAAEEATSAAVIEETPMQTTEVHAEETGVADGETYAVDIEALLAIEDQRVRRILTRKVAAFMADRRYTSSIGKFVRAAGSIEALLRRDGPVVRIPLGYEPVDSTDQGDGPVSLVAFANGGEDAAKLVRTITPPPAKKRGRPSKKKEALVKVAPAKAKAKQSEVSKVAKETEVSDLVVEDTVAVIQATARTALDPASFAVVLTTAIADAIAPYLDAAGTGFRDGKEGLAASEYLARALEAEAALLRLSAFGRGAKD